MTTMNSVSNTNPIIIQQNRKKQMKIAQTIIFFATLAVLLTLSFVAFAAGDPITQINNFESKLSQLIEAVGVIALLVGVVMLAMGLASHDPSQKMNGGLIMGAGALLAGATYVVSNWF